MPQVEVTPNPIRDAIQPSGLRLEIVDQFTVPNSNSSAPLARVNFTYHADDGSDRLFVADSRGEIWIYRNDVRDPQAFLDISSVSGFIEGPQSGLRSFAFHPDYENPGTDGFGKFYTLATFSLGSASRDVTILEANADNSAALYGHDVVTEWQVRANDPSRIDMNSAREVVRVEEILRDHNADQVMFDPNAKPGDADYGMLYFGTGDGGNFAQSPDPFGNAQDLGSALGKILRIDPLEQTNGDSYGVPSDNPFVGDAGALPEIWALGLRHPGNFSFDSAGDGVMLIADIGQAHIEEINQGKAGANYGWSMREGTFVTVANDQETLFSLPDNDANFGFEYPVLQFDRSEEAVNNLLAVTGGYVYRGSEVPELTGQYLFGDLVSGRIFHVPVDDLGQGRQTTIEELTLLRDGKVVTLLDLVGQGRVDLRFGQDESGEVYITTKQDGVVRTLSSDGTSPPTPAPSGPDFTLALGSTERGDFGHRYNGQTASDGLITATFENTGTNATLSLRGYDVDFTNEIKVTLNGQDLGFLSQGPNNGLNSGDSFTIDATDQRSGTNTLTFEQNLNNGFIWGVTDVRLDATGIPSPEPEPEPSGADFTLALGRTESGEFGHRYNGQTASDGIITATFQNIGGDAALSLRGYDVDFSDEIKVTLNGQDLGFLKQGPNNGLNSGDNFTIDAADQRSGTNTLTFEQNLNNGYIWGVSDISLKNSGNPSPNPTPVPAGADFSLALGTTETGEFGNRYNGQTASDGVITATFENTGTNATLSLLGYDVDFANEIKVTLNGQDLGFLGQGPNNGLNSGDSFTINAAVQIAGTNTLSFEQNLSNTYIWGVTNIRIDATGDTSPMPAPEPSPGDLAALFPSTLVTGTSNSESITGTSADELVNALGGDDIQHGQNGNDVLIIGAGRDKNYGGSGTDFAVFDGDITDFSGVDGVRDAYQITDTNPGDGDLGFDRVKAVEILVFDDALFDTRTGRSESFTNTSQLVQRLDDLITSNDVIA